MLPAREVQGLAFRFHQIGLLLLPQVAAVQLLKLLDSVEEINAGDAKRPCTSPRQGRAQTISNTTSLVSRVCSATRSSTATSQSVTPLPPTTNFLAHPPRSSIPLILPFFPSNLSCPPSSPFSNARVLARVCSLVSSLFHSSLANTPSSRLCRLTLVDSVSCGSLSTIFSQPTCLRGQVTFFHACFLPPSGLKTH